MHRKVWYGVLILICATLVTVMFLHKTKIYDDHSEKQNEPLLQEENTWENEKEIVEGINDHLKFDAKVIIPEKYSSGIFKETYGTYQEYDYDGFFRYFSDIESVVEETQYDLPDRTNKKTTGRCLDTQNGESICLYPIKLIYTRNQLNEQYFYVFDDNYNNASMYNADHFLLESEIQSVPVENVINECENLLKSAVLSCGEYLLLTYALDLPTMKQQYERIYDWGFDDGTVDIYDWKESDEAYVIRLWQTVQDLPIMTASVNYYDVIDNSDATVTAIYRKDGFAEVSIGDIFSMEYGEEKRIITSSDVKDKIIQKYSEVLSEDKITVIEIRLCALASKAGDGKCNILPVWICNYQVESDENNAFSQMLINAFTGEEIYAN